MNSSPLLKVAVADDHPLMRRGIIETVQRSPRFKVIADAGNGQELIARLLDTETPDICLIDLQMPVLDGYDTIAALKKRYPETKYLVLTFLENEYNIIKAIRVGAHGYLLKSNDPEEILTALNTLDRIGIYYSDIASSIVYDRVAVSQYPELTERENDVLKQICNDWDYEDIAASLNISVHTVHHHIKGLFKKLKVKSRIGLALFAMRSGLLSAR